MKSFLEIQKAYQAAIPFVIYKNPNRDVVNVMIQKTRAAFIFDDFSKSGYVFAPFDDREASYIIKPDVFFSEKLTLGSLSKTRKINLELDETQKDEHMFLVKKAMETIEKGDLKKVVLSRKEEIDLMSVDPFSILKQLLYRYEDSYVYMWFHPKVGLWMGASPEILLKVYKHVFKTMALAGTQFFEKDSNPNWDFKEIEEQGIVFEEIKTQLENENFQLKISKLKTVKAANLLHLKTDIEGRLSGSKDIEKIVKLLHPTSAVCGFPKEESKRYILKNEKYQRSFYTGYLGEINLNKRTTLYVNIRCFQWIDEKAHLYIGGGITSSSDPEKEWKETVEKSKTIKSVF